MTSETPENQGESPHERSDSGPQTPGARSTQFDAMLSDVPLELAVELGRVTLSLRDVAERLGPGSVIPLAKLAGERLDIRINNYLVARGEAVAVGERYGVRVVEIINAKGDSSS